MTTRKSMTLPIIITFILIIVIVYFFVTIKQTEVYCEKTKTFDMDVRLLEEVTSVIDGKKIDRITVKKTIVLPEKYRDENHLNQIKERLNSTLEYLGENVGYQMGSDRIIVEISVHKNEIILLDNIKFVVTNDLQIEVNSNTKSSEVIPLSIGDNYTDGELMTRFKNSGYSCK